MKVMANKKPKPDPHKQKQFQIRLHPLVRKQLELLTKKNLSKITEEVRLAIIEHLKRNDLWPPSQP